MGSLATSLFPFFDWLVRTTCQAGLLICLILLLQKALGPRLGVRGRYCLWLVVLIRMAMPSAPQSWVSINNLLPLPSLHDYETAMGLGAGMAEAAAAARRGTSTVATPLESDSAASGTSGVTSVRHTRPFERNWWGTRITMLVSLLWLAGSCSLAGYVVASGIRLRNVVRRGRPVTDHWILALLGECQRLLDVRAGVAMIATDEVGSPALSGLLRPRLLLPRETLAQRDRGELRHIFLHELAHLKRHDILIGHVASALHILHWFNPLVGLGLRRMRADRELACDGMVLSVLHSDETCAYGHTIVRQIERLLASPWRPVVAGLYGSRNQIRQRIAMISRFQKETYRRSALTTVLVGCLACVGLTDGFAAALDWDLYARRDFRTTHRDRHANIQRCCIRNLETGKYLAVEGERVVCEADEPGAAGLWEFRFDEATNTPADIMYFYSVSARKYLTSDERGNLAVNAQGPEETARWAAWPRPDGVFVISHHFQDGYLRLDEQGQVHAENFGRDSRGYWDIHSVWRVKTSDDPRSNPQWQREHIPGPD